MLREMFVCGFSKVLWKSQHRPSLFESHILNLDAGIVPKIGLLNIIGEYVFKLATINSSLPVVVIELEMFGRAYPPYGDVPVSNVIVLLDAERYCNTPNLLFVKLFDTILNMTFFAVLDATT